MVLIRSLQSRGAGLWFYILIVIASSLLSLATSSFHDSKPNAVLSTATLSQSPFWLSTDSLPIAMKQHSVAIGTTLQGERIIITTGGRSGSSEIISHVYYSRLIPDGSILEWFKGEDDIKGQTYRHASVIYNGRIYIIGGCREGFCPSDLVYFADLDSNTGVTEWEKTQKPLLRTVYHHSAIELNGRIYVIGGCSTGSTYPLSNVLSGTVRSDGDIAIWREELPIPEPSGLMAHASIACATCGEHGSIFVFGGWTGDQHGTALRKVYQGTLDAQGHIEAWTWLGEDSPKSDLPLPESIDGLVYHSAVPISKKVYVFGGELKAEASGTLTDTVYVATIKDDGNLLWTAYLESLPLVLSRSTGTVNDSGIIYTVGGVSPYCQPNEYCNQVFYTPLAILTKAQAPQDKVTYGDTLTYTLWYTANTIRDLANVTISDTFPTETEYLSGSLVAPGPLTCPTPDDNRLVCSADLLREGEKGFVSFQLRVTPSTASLAGLRAALPDWFTAGLIDVSQSASSAHSSHSLSALQLDGRASPAVRRIGNSSPSIAALESRSVTTTTTVAPQCTAPTILRVYPNSLCNDADTRITIEGADFAPNARVRLGDIELSGVTFVSSQRLTAVAPGGLAPGVYSLTVINPDGDLSDTLPSAVTIYDAAIAVTGVYPFLGVNDRTTPITVTGQNFIPTPTVILESVALTNVVYLSSTAVTAVVPRGLDPGYYHLTVTNPPPCQSSATMRAAFTVTRGAFFLTGASPIAVCNDQMTPITITGANFPSLPFVYMDGQPLQVTGVTSSEIDAIVPGLMPTGVYSLTVLGEGPCPDSTESLEPQAISPGILCWYTDTLASALTVLSRDVAIADVDPKWAWNTATTTVTITGSNFWLSSTVSLGDQSLDVTWKSTSQLVVTIPPGIAPDSYKLTIANPPPCEGEDDIAFRVIDDSPVIVTNVAYLCIEDLGCVPSNRVRNPPYRAYLPLILKQ